MTAPDSSNLVRRWGPPNIAPGDLTLGHSMQWSPSCTEMTTLVFTAKTRSQTKIKQNKTKQNDSQMMGCHHDTLIHTLSNDNNITINPLNTKSKDSQTLFSTTGNAYETTVMQMSYGYNNTNRQSTSQGGITAHHLYNGPGPPDSAMLLRTHRGMLNTIYRVDGNMKTRDTAVPNCPRLL